MLDSLKERSQQAVHRYPPKFHHAINPNHFCWDQARIFEPPELRVLVMVVALVPAPKSHPSPPPNNNNRFLSLSAGSLFRGFFVFLDGLRTLQALSGPGLSSALVALKGNPPTHTHPRGKFSSLPTTGKGGLGSSPAPRTPLARAFLASPASNEGAKALRYPPPPGIRRAPQPERDPPNSGAWRAASPRGPTLQARKGGAAGTHRRGSPRPRSAVRLSGGPNAEGTVGGAARRGLCWCTRAGSMLSRVAGKTQAPRGRPHCSACRARPGGAWPCGLKPRWRRGNGRGTASAATAAAAPHAGGERSPHLWRRA